MAPSKRRVEGGLGAGVSLGSCFRRRQDRAARWWGRKHLKNLECMEAGVIAAYLSRAGPGTWRACSPEGWLTPTLDPHEVKEGGGCWLGKAALGSVPVDTPRGDPAKAAPLRSLVDAASPRSRPVGSIPAHEPPWLPVGSPAKRTQDLSLSRGVPSHPGGQMPAELCQPSLLGLHLDLTLPGQLSWGPG